MARLGAVRAGLEQAQVLAGRLDGAPQVTPAVAAVARRALQLFVKCFGFDYADESANVVVPPSWRPIVTRGDAAHTVMATLFYLHKHQARRKRHRRRFSEHRTLHAPLASACHTQLRQGDTHCRVL